MGAQGEDAQVDADRPAFGDVDELVDQAVVQSGHVGDHERARLVRGEGQVVLGELDQPAVDGASSTVDVGRSTSRHDDGGSVRDEADDPVDQLPGSRAAEQVRVVEDQEEGGRVAVHGRGELGDDPSPELWLGTGELGPESGDVESGGAERSQQVVREDDRVVVGRVEREPP